VNSILHAEGQLPDFGTIGLVESRYRSRELGGRRSRECFASVGFLSLETILLPGRQRSHDYNAIQRIDAESWGHTRGRRQVANPRRVRPARRRKKNTLSPPLRLTSFDPRSHPLSPRGRVDIRPASNVAVSDLHKVVNESPRYL